MNVAHSALGDKSKIYLPPLHMKRGLMKICVRQMDKESLFKVKFSQKK